MKIENSVVLVTGGTGSFGNFIVNRLLKLGAAEVRILSRDEKKQYDMKILHKKNPKLKFFIGDIRDASRVNEVMRGVDIVYQAAALKHVPVCEDAPMEAVKTNINGVDNVITSALNEGVKKFISISTDKAVKPVNVMGMSKALQEKLTTNANHSVNNVSTRFCCVRYGNVMNSRGSVIPFFRNKLDDDEVLPITDEGMTRFLLTLEDAIDLVMFATEHMKGGEIFVKKSPAAKITDIAKTLAHMKGKEFNYHVIGKFPGEKLHEVLISEEEMQRTQDMGDYFVVHPWWDKSKYEVVNFEYESSTDLVSSVEDISKLIESSDEEFNNIGYRAGEFSIL